MAETQSEEVRGQAKLSFVGQGGVGMRNKVKETDEKSLGSGKSF